MSQRGDKVIIGESHIYSETENDKGEITIESTSLKLGRSGEITERTRMGTSLFRRLGPPPKKGIKGIREDLRERLGKKMATPVRKEERQHINPNKAD